MTLWDDDDSRVSKTEGSGGLSYPGLKGRGLKVEALNLQALREVTNRSRAVYVPRGPKTCDPGHKSKDFLITPELI